MACGCPGPRPPAHRFRDPHAPRASPPTGPEPGESCGVLLPVSLTQTLTNRAGDGLLSGTGGSPVGLTGPWQPGATQAGVARLLPAVRGHAHRGLPCPGLSWPHPQQPEGALFVQPRCPAPVRTGAIPHRRHPSRSPPRSEPLSPAQPSVRCGPARPPRALLRSVRGGHGNGQVWTRAGRPEAPSRPPPPASGRFRSSPGPAPLDGGLGHSCSPVRGGEI